MTIKTYNVVQNYWLIDAFYPLGSTITTDELMAKPYVDLGVLQEQAPPPPPPEDDGGNDDSEDNPIVDPDNSDEENPETKPSDEDKEGDNENNFPAEEDAKINKLKAKNKNNN